MTAAASSEASPAPRPWDCNSRRAFELFRDQACPHTSPLVAVTELLFWFPLPLNALSSRQSWPGFPAGVPPGSVSEHDGLPASHAGWRAAELLTPPVTICPASSPRSRQLSFSLSAHSIRCRFRQFRAKLLMLNAHNATALLWLIILSRWHIHRGLEPYDMERRKDFRGRIWRVLSIRTPISVAASFLLSQCGCLSILPYRRAHHFHVSYISLFLDLSRAKRMLGIYILITTFHFWRISSLISENIVCRTRQMLVSYRFSMTMFRFMMTGDIFHRDYARYAYIIYRAQGELMMACHVSFCHKLNSTILFTDIFDRYFCCAFIWLDTFSRMTCMEPRFKFYSQIDYFLALIRFAMQASRWLF